MRERAAWILGGIAAAVPVAGLLLFWLNLNGGSKPVEIPSLPQSPPGPSHPRLQVLDEPGRWWESKSSASNASVTNSNTCHLDARWGLNGHCLFLEEKVFDPFGVETYEFAVKHYNTKNNRYHYTLVQHDGYVRGFEGYWKVGLGRIEWRSVYLPGAPNDVVQRMHEMQLAPGKRETRTEISRAGQLEITAVTRAERKGSAQTELPATPATPELARLGRSGIWKESQSKTVAGQPETKQMTGRARWTPGGRALLYEGVIHSESEKEYFMWIKTYDREMKVYRSIHFHTDGPVDHYEGRWEEAAKTITWRSVQSPKNILIRETFVSPTHRNWRVEAYDDQGKTSDSIDGESKLEE
jgi:hypothetical protein